MRISMMFVIVMTTGSFVSQAVALPPGYPWIDYNQHFYALTLDTGSWPDMEAEAVSLGYHLVAISDADENGWVFDNFGGQDNRWIGLYQLPGSNEPADGWVWSNGEPVTYTNWISGEPNDDQLGEHWAEMKGSIWPGQWNDKGSDAVFAGVIETPEPSTAVLLTLGSLVLLKRRRSA